VDHGGGNPIPADFDQRDYNLTRERTGFVGNFDWRPNDEMQFYLRTQYSKFTDHETRDRFRLPIAGTIVPTSATAGRSPRPRAPATSVAATRTTTPRPCRPAASSTSGPAS
jgi:hypothetical protein